MMMTTNHSSSFFKLSSFDRLDGRFPPRVYLKTGARAQLSRLAYAGHDCETFLGREKRNDRAGHSLEKANKEALMSNMVLLPGGRKVPVRGARVVGEVDPEHVMSVTAVLRPKEGFSIEAHLASGAAPMSREEFAARHGADPDDVARVAAYAGEQHLTVSDVNIGGRTVVLTGRTGDMETAFNVDFKMYATPDNRRYRGREGDIY